MISANKLSIRFRNEDRWQEVVHPVSFTVEQGEVLGIVGESGAGKSVISLAIMGLLPKHSTRISGSILSDSIDLLKLSSRELQAYRGNKLAMIFQEPMTSLNPVLTCGYQVAETIRRHQQKILDKQQVRKAVETLFEEVSLPAPSRIYGSYPHQLSGGQKQRVMIAMALSCNPELLIADEPTTALDATAQKLILELLLQVVRRRNMSMIFISHDLDVIGRVADRVLVMKNGQLIEAGTVHEVLNHPKEAYTKALIASRPVMGQKLAKLPVPENFTGDQPEPLHKLFTTPEIDARLNRLYSHKPLICVQDLQTWYPVNRGLFSRNKEYVKAVDTVSFDIYPGEVAGLVGESGCGKTTLGRSILRLVEPTAGSVLWKGQNILDFTKREMNRHRTCMQIMFQDPYSSLNPAMTVGESITEPMRFHGLFGNKRQQKERAAWLLEKVMMQADHADRYPHEFSGGQRQRISIARALALQPEFIVCDETVSALDVSVQAQVLNLLRDLQQEFNLTYLFISHDLSVVHHFCDKILVMNKGRIEETGAASQVLSAPSSEYTRRLLEAAF